MAVGSYGVARPLLTQAFERMPQLLAEGEEFAAQGIGVPFWWPP